MIETIIHLLAIVFIISFIRSCFGFGDALIGMPLLLLSFPVAQSMIIGSLYGIIISIILIASWHKNILKAGRELVYLIVFLLIGASFGVLFVLYGNTRIILTLLSILLIAYPLIYFTSFSKFTVKFGIFTFIFGILAGFIGGSVSANGPLYVIYGQLRKWEKGLFVAFLQPLFFIESSFNLTAYSISCGIKKEYLLITALSIPIIIINSFLGSKLRGIIGNRFDFLIVAIIFIGGWLLLFTRVM
ncbi:MAG: sulfite exporter TauE/SafE family protein [Lentisphaerota bacterium]